MSHKPQKQIADAKRQPVDDDDDFEQLLQCISSGHAEAAQLVQHLSDSDLNQPVDSSKKMEA